MKIKLKIVLSWILWLIWPVDAGGMFFLALTVPSYFFCVVFAMTGTLSVIIAQRTSPESIRELLG